MLFKSAVLALAGSAVASKRAQLSFGQPAAESISEQATIPSSVLPAYEWLTSAGIFPCPRATYTLAELQTVAYETFGEDAVWRCAGKYLSGVFWSSETEHKSNCPETGIKWLPEELMSKSKPEPPTGEIILSVVPITTGVATGCLGVGGMWSLGLCGSFNVTNVNETAVPVALASDIPNNFTLTTLKGNCTAEGGAFACANSTKVIPSYFQADLDDSLLIFNGTTQFYSPFVPMIPWMKIPLLTTPKLTSINCTVKISPAPAPAA